MSTESTEVTDSLGGTEKRRFRSLNPTDRSQARQSHLIRDWVNATPLSRTDSLPKPCAHIITPPLFLTPGTRLGPYEVLTQIGAGGMGGLQGHRHQPET